MLDKSVLEKLIDRTPIAIILVGVVVFIIGAAGGFPVGNPPLHVADFAWRIGLGVMGLILVVIGVLLLWREGGFSKKDFDLGNETLTLAEFPTLAAAVPLLAKIASREQEKLSLAIIASTGGTTISSVLPTILRSAHAPSVDISLCVINKSGPLIRYFPKHWTQEVEIVLDRIKNGAIASSTNRVTLNVYTYDYVPILHGIMINKTHLLVGFFGWKHFSGRIELSGAENPHRYYFIEKQPSAQYIFDVFGDWVENMPRQMVYSFPPQSGKQAQVRRPK